MTRTCGTNSRFVIAIVASRGVGRPPLTTSRPRGSRYTTAVRRSVRSVPSRSTTAIWPLTTACAPRRGVAKSRVSAARTNAARRRRKSELKADRQVEVSGVAGDTGIELGGDTTVLEPDDDGLRRAPEQMTRAHRIAAAGRPVVIVRDVD